MRVIFSCNYSNFTIKKISQVSNSLDILSRYTDISERHMQSTLSDRQVQISKVLSR